MLEGKNVLMGPMEAEHLPFLAALAANRRVATAVVGWDFPPAASLQQAWFERVGTDRNTRRFVLLHKETGAPVGMTGLWEIDWHNRSALSAIKLDVDEWGGQGLGTDGIMLMAAYAFYDVGLNRLHSTILDFNAPSLRAYVRKCGWTVEGVHRQATFRNGEFHDSYQIGILRADYDDLRESREYRERLYPVDTAPVAPELIDGDGDP